MMQGVIKRINYIDAIRGLAIFLVVMGHSIAWTFDDITEPSVISSPAALLWHIIYSFHMPLLMFCSGLLFPQRCSIQYLWKRLLTLLIPYFVAGILLKMCRGGVLNYWFLLSLFYFILITSIPNLLFNSHSWWKRTEIPLYMLLAAVVWGLSIKLRKYQYSPLLDIEHASLFPYFVLGIMSSRLELIDRYYSNKSIVSLMLILSPLLFILYNTSYLPVHINTILKLLVPIPTIYVISFLMKSNNDNQSKSFTYLKLLGRYSLEIYIIHFFFTAKVPQIGNYFLGVSYEPYAWMKILTPQLVLSSISSIIIIGLCFIVMKIIWISPLISQILFGRHQESKSI